MQSPEASKGKPRVLLSVPCGTGWMHKSVVFAVARMLGDPRVDVTFIAPTHQPFVHALHLVVRDFLAGGYDFLLSIDADNPPNQNPLDLVSLDLDVVGCPTPVWHCDASSPGDRPYYLNALREVEDEDGSIGFRPLDAYEGFVSAGLQRADAVGTGCILIARRVLEKLAAFSETTGDPLASPFFRAWNPDGTVAMGNDYAFCRRARASGFEVWAHFDYTCKHFVEMEITEVVNSMAACRSDVNG